MIRDNTQNMLNEVDRLIKQKLTTSALLVERSAKQLCPVRTGTLKRSINREIEPRRAIIGTNVEYAPYVEMGTRYWSGKPYLRPALEMNAGKIREIFGAR